MSKNLLSINDLSKDEIIELIDFSNNFFDDTGNFRKEDLFPDKTIANVFCEPSTRTKSSFAIAANNLGCSVIDFDVEKHQFEGEQKIVYTNNSPDLLDKVFYHLYFNAFQPGSMMDVRSRTIEDPDPRVGDRIAGLTPDKIGYQKVKTGMDIDKIEQMIEDRNNCRSEKNFQRADEIRYELKLMGIEIEDTAKGTI